MLHGMIPASIPPKPLAGHERRATMEKSSGRTAAQQRRIQSKIDESDRAQAKKPDDEQPMQAGARRYPELPFPRQHQPKPGHEYKLDPEPLYDAPHYLEIGRASCRDRRESAEES